VRRCGGGGNSNLALQKICKLPAYPVRPFAGGNSVQRFFLSWILALLFGMSSQVYAGQSCIVLDLDDTLVFRPRRALDAVGKASMKVISSAGFTVDVDGTRYILFPGTLKFLKKLSSLQNTRVLFFSLGSQERNQELIEKMLALAFPQAEYERLYQLGNFRIFSRDDSVEDPETRKPKKDLRITGCDLKNTLLVDDNPEIVLKGQEINHLYVPGEFSVNKYFADPYKSSFTSETQFALNHLFYAAGQIQSVMALRSKSVGIAQAWGQIYTDSAMKRDSYEKISADGMSYLDQTDEKVPDEVLPDASQNSEGEAMEVEPAPKKQDRRKVRKINTVTRARARAIKMGFASKRTIQAILANLGQTGDGR